MLVIPNALEHTRQGRFRRLPNQSFLFAMGCRYRETIVYCLKRYSKTAVTALTTNQRFICILRGFVAPIMSIDN